VLIATEATLAAGLYDGHGIELLTPSDAVRTLTGELIARAVHGDPPRPDEMTDLLARARQPGAAIVLGCTDICGLLGPGDAARAGAVESLACLAERCAQALLVGAPVG
jgi:aspartate/glutamate racemase